MRPSSGFVDLKAREREAVDFFSLTPRSQSDGRLASRGVGSSVDVLVFDLGRRFGAAGALADGFDGRGAVGSDGRGGASSKFALDEEPA